MRLPRIAIYTSLVIITIFWLLFILSWAPLYKTSELEYGVTFSKQQSAALGLNWKENYIALLDDLGVKRIRLPAYWNEIQPEPGRYNWEDLDWQIDEAEKRGASVILVLGQRVPRWPECHIPSWAESLSTSDRQEATLTEITEIIARYRRRPSITFWQVENEPFLLQFGECPPFDVEFFDKEIALVRSLDTRPIIVTDSGELSLWAQAAKRADVFGSTLYRDTYSSHLQRYIHYPISPAFFRVKKNIANLFAHPQDWIIIELQGEPWGKKAFQELPQAERDITMTPQKFKDMVEFVRQTGFRTFYWWGVEFWYWEKEINHNDAYWQEAKALFNHSS